MARVEKRYDFLVLFDVKDGNPNGDPDMDGAPRIDPETLQGMVSDVCLKRKIKNWISEAKKNAPGYRIFVQKGISLETHQSEPFRLVASLKDKEKNDKKVEKDDISKARDWMVKNFFDIRAFGAVMNTTAFNCGQVEGPVQLTFARSIDPILTENHCITRMAYTKEAKRQESDGENEMGRKHTVAYGLYKVHGFVSKNTTGFEEEDLALLWKAIQNMFDLDRSASRGLMATQKLFVFEHESSLGECPSNKLFDLVKVVKKQGVEFPRTFTDYSVTIDKENPPKGVKLTVL